MYRLDEAPICVGAVLAAVSRPECGAVASFLGTARDHTGARRTSFLVYEAYDAMAQRTLAEIGAEARARWRTGPVAVVHRTGRVEIGEVCVLVAVASAHRAEALDACRYIIDQLKARAPIWKREAGPDGAFWVEGTRA